MGERIESLLKISKVFSEGLPDLQVVFEYAKESKSFTPILE